MRIGRSLTLSIANTCVFSCPSATLVQTVSPPIHADIAAWAALAATNAATIGGSSPRNANRSG